MPTPSFSVMFSFMPVFGSVNTARPCGVADEQPLVHLPIAGIGKLEMLRSPDDTVRWSTNDADTTLDSRPLLLPQVASYFWVKPSPLLTPPVYAVASAPLNSLRMMMLMTPAIASEP